MAGIPAPHPFALDHVGWPVQPQLIFDDNSTSDINREHVLERLSQVNLPANLVPQMGTDWSPVVPDLLVHRQKAIILPYDVMTEKKSPKIWTLEKSFKGVTGRCRCFRALAARTKEYQIRLDPEKLVAYGLSISQVEQQIASGNNTNGGGSFIEQGAQQVNVQSLGLYTSVQDIENTVIKTANGRYCDQDQETLPPWRRGPKSFGSGQIGRSTPPCQMATILDNPDDGRRDHIPAKGETTLILSCGGHSRRSSQAQCGEQYPAKGRKDRSIPRSPRTW